MADGGPVRISDLISKGMEMEVHCLKCGRFRLLTSQEAAWAVDFAMETALVDIRRFGCSHCGSRDTECRPHYPSKPAGASETYGMKPPE